MQCHLCPDLATHNVMGMFLCPLHVKEWDKQYSKGAEAIPSRHLCGTHPNVDYKTAWGCPDCVRELRQENAKLKREVERLQKLATEYEDHLIGLNAIDQ